MQTGVLSIIREKNIPFQVPKHVDDPRTDYPHFLYLLRKLLQFSYRSVWNIIVRYLGKRNSTRKLGKNCLNSFFLKINKIYICSHPSWKFEETLQFIIYISIDFTDMGNTGRNSFPLIYCYALSMVATLFMIYLRPLTFTGCFKN